MMNIYLLFLDMPSIKSDLYAVQISANIFKLTNSAPIPFEILSIFGLFNQPALLRFFEQHQALGVDIAPFVFGMLVHAAMMLDGAEVFNPDRTGFTTSMNLYINLIGEPGECILVFLIHYLVIIHLFRYQ